MEFNTPLSRNGDSQEYQSLVCGHGYGFYR